MCTVVHNADVRGAGRSWKKYISHREWTSR